MSRQYQRDDVTVGCEPANARSANNLGPKVGRPDAWFWVVNRKARMYDSQNRTSRPSYPQLFTATQQHGSRDTCRGKEVARHKAINRARQDHLERECENCDYFLSLPEIDRSLVDHEKVNSFSWIPVGRQQDNKEPV